MQCNGHESGPEVVHDRETNGPVTSDVVSGGLMDDNEAIVSAAAAVDAAVNNGQPQVDATAHGEVRPPILCSSTTENKVDPVTEIAPDLQVKIADLGNACWVVSST